MKQIATIGGLYLFATPFGYLLNWLGVPLAWMIGPMIATATLVSCGFVRQKIPTNTRPFGQVVVSTFVGAHFSPEAFHALSQTAPLVIGICLFTLVGALFVAQLQIRIFGTDPVTAILSVVPTSPVEAGILAEHHKVSPTPVIFSQTMRIAMVVLVVPFMLFLVNGSAATTALEPQTSATDLGGLWIMIGGAIAGVVVFKRFRLTNPFFLGPLLASSTLAAWGYQTFVIPNEVLYLAQLVLGTWLGSCFRPELWRSGNSVISSVFLSSSLLILMCWTGSFLISLVVDVPLSTLVLGAAPGGATEMALTAGILGLDVAFVTVIHLARIFIIMPSLNRIVRLSQKNSAQ
jgi:membrane AbrB-like protein